MPPEVRSVPPLAWLPAGSASQHRSAASRSSAYAAARVSTV